MLTRALGHSANWYRWAGSGLTAGRSRSSNQLHRLPSVFWKRRRDPALDLLDCGLHLRLVLWRAGPRRQLGGSVMGGQFLVPGIQVRLVAAGLADPGLLVVRDHKLGHPPQDSNIRTWDIAQSGALPRFSGPRCGTSDPYSRRTPSRLPGRPAAAPRRGVPATPCRDHRSGCNDSRWDAPSDTPATAAAA